MFWRYANNRLHTRKTRQSEGQLNPIPQRTWMCTSWPLKNYDLDSNYLCKLFKIFHKVNSYGGEHLTFTMGVATQLLLSAYHLIIVITSAKLLFVSNQRFKSYETDMKCRLLLHWTFKCDIDLKGSNPIIATCTSFHNGDDLCQVILFFTAV
jgi:hypothetical protein